MWTVLISRFIPWIHLKLNNMERLTVEQRIARLDKRVAIFEQSLNIQMLSLIKIPASCTLMQRIRLSRMIEIRGRQMLYNMALIGACTFKNYSSGGTLGGKI